VTVLLIALAILLWIMSMASLSNLHGSDAAGNGLASAFGLLASIGLWIVLLILLVASAMRGGWPAWAKWAGFVLVPACAAANFIALDLLNDSFYKAKWPIVVPEVAPVLLIAYALWSYSTSLQAAVPAGTAGGAVWGAILILSLVPWPEYVYRSRHGKDDKVKAEAAFKASEPQRMAAARQAKLAELDQLGPDSSLRAWMEFAGPESEIREQAFERIRHLARRQSDAETMFREGANYLERYLADLDLQATPEICEGSQRFFLKMLDDIRTTRADPPPFGLVQVNILPYMPGLKWMAEHKCDCGATLDELEKVVRAYKDSPERSQFLEGIAAMRGPR
jgi:hypothetical protein